MFFMARKIYGKTISGVYNLFLLTANETEHQKQKPTFVVAWVLFRFLLLDDPLLLLDVAILLLDDPFLLLEVPPEKNKTRSK